MHVYTYTVHHKPFDERLRSTVSPKCFAERLRAPFRRDRDHDLREALHVVPKERLRPSPVALPAFAEPRPHGALHPRFLVVEQLQDQLERLVEILREDEILAGKKSEGPPPEVGGCP